MAQSKKKTPAKKSLPIRFSPEEKKRLDAVLGGRGHKYQSLIEDFLHWYEDTGRTPWLEPNQGSPISGQIDRLIDSIATLQKALDSKTVVLNPKQSYMKQPQYMEESLDQIKQHATDITDLLESLKEPRVGTEGTGKHGKPVDVLAVAAKGSRLAKEILAGVARIDSRPERDPRRPGVPSESTGSDGQQNDDQNGETSAGRDASG